MCICVSHIEKLYDFLKTKCLYIYIISDILYLQFLMLFKYPNSNGF